MGGEVEYPPPLKKPLRVKINNNTMNMFQIRYVSYTKINKTIYKVLTLLFYGGGEVKYPPPTSKKNLNKG